jgi:FtsZ-binding cell division protein ZapB
MRTQTAVEWLIEQLTPSISLQQKHIDELKEKAKEMEKEQTCQFVSDYLDDGQDITAEEYYEQIFNPEKL